ncbi:hypothetical protein E4U53_008205 [Claviceps sorghi]|nr:hypothetical protein E4U53_008205 [Claviceps sorghi]
MLANIAIVVVTITSLARAAPQSYPNKCGDEVCPADKPECCEIIVDGEAELGCFVQCPPESPSDRLHRRQGHPGQCNDQVRAAETAECREVRVRGVAKLGLGVLSGTPPAATSGPKCGDSFFCPVDEICCPDRLYTCADTIDQCPE